MNPEKKQPTFTTGKRKRALARARIQKGSGRVWLNSVPLEKVGNEMVRMRIQEPLVLAGDALKSHDISVTVKGGGPMGQADAARQAIGKGIVAIAPELKDRLLEYDSLLLVPDPRRTEPHKPPRSSQGPRRYKQRSKR